MRVFFSRGTWKQIAFQSYKEAKIVSNWSVKVYVYPFFESLFIVRILLQQKEAVKAMNEGLINFSIVCVSEKRQMKLCWTFGLRYTS